MRGRGGTEFVSFWGFFFFYGGWFFCNVFFLWLVVLFALGSCCLEGCCVVDGWVRSFWCCVGVGWVDWTGSRDGAVGGWMLMCETVRDVLQRGSSTQIVELDWLEDSLHQQKRLDEAPYSHLRAFTVEREREKRRLRNLKGQEQAVRTVNPSMSVPRHGWVRMMLTGF